ncbi:Gnk2-homologous domain [Macleaya cordata]|uniref:Gnk2-homologous domain n=1 Tax=Macleaya cordata TaxID=56857 RepID=A0A200QC39_MACCD|nr:Gnk2-homologous domain [Macleaya cordata]
MFMELHRHFSHDTIFFLSLKLSSLFLLFSSLSSPHHHVNAYMFIYGGCSQDRYQPDSPFQSNLNSLLASIVSSASQSSYNSFAIGNGTSTPDAPAVYGLYQCRGDLKIPDCTTCVQNAVGQINLVCPYSFAAGLQLEGCYVRYENVDFLGKPDTTVLFKKCSRSTSNDVEFYKRRDDVLADLQSATSFRVSSLGLVEGFAQCLGDLSPSDCSSCLSEAVGKLKNTCGSASAADVYLGQCYARYWASGYYGSTTGEMVLVPG